MSKNSFRRSSIIPLLTILGLMLATAVTSHARPINNHYVPGTDNAGGSYSASEDTSVPHSTKNDDNAAPKLGEIEVIPAEINEGESFFLSAAIINPVGDDSLTLIVDWGNEVIETMELPAGSHCFSFCQSYADDPPGIASGEFYTMTLTLTNDRGDRSKQTAVIKINNLPPEIDAGPDKTAMKGQLLDFQANITDPGLPDTHTITWDFGDGTPETTGRLADHHFTTPGKYSVVVTAVDDDGGVGQDILSVVVTDFGLIYFPLLLQP